MPSLVRLVSNLTESSEPMIIIRRRNEHDSEVVVYKPVGRYTINRQDWARIIGLITEHFDCRIVARGDREELLECVPA